MFNVQEGQTLREKLTSIVAERSDEIQRMLPKLDMSDENLLLFVGRILIGNIFFCFRCRLTKKGRGAIDTLRTEFSNGYIEVSSDGVVDIGIDDINKLQAFLSSTNNPYIEEESAQIVRK